VSNRPEALQIGSPPQRSPSAPLFISPLSEHNRRVTSQFDVSEDVAKNKRTTSRRQRSLSADGVTIANTSLRRGRPNTIKSGLPSPVNRQISDPAGCRIPLHLSTDADHDENRLATVVIDTSPILGKSECRYLKQDCEDFVPKCQLIHQISKDSIGSLVADDASDTALDQAFIGSVLDSENIMAASGIDLDITESSASTVDEHSMSTCSAASDADLFIDNQILSTPVDQQRRIDPMERYIVLPDRSAGSHALTSCSSLSAPKIKPSLMPATAASRLLSKANCSPRVCSDSPVSSGRLVARSGFIDPQN